MVLNGHNDTDKIGILLERIKRRLNIEQGTGNLAPNTLVLTFRHSPVPPSSLLTTPSPQPLASYSRRLRALHALPSSCGAFLPFCFYPPPCPLFL